MPAPSLRRLAPLAVLLALAGCGAASEPVRRLTILHTNDLHARLLPDERGRGGFAALAATIRRECETAAACLVLDGGDLVQGSPVSSLYRGLPVFEIANLLPLDASTLGNHEFDYGWERIADFAGAAEFPIVTANVVDDDGRVLGGVPWVVLEAGQLKIGVVGVLTETLPELVRDEHVGPWKVLPVVDTVRRYLPALVARADLVVVLGHLVDEEQEAILAELPQVAAVISGHGHGRLAAPHVVGGRPAVRVQAYGRQLGRLDLRVRVRDRAVVDWKWKALEVRADRTGSDPRVAESVARWEALADEVVGAPIGEARRALGPAETRRLVERALREKLGVDVAYVNPGGIRDGLPRGRLLARHVWNVLPFDNRVVVGRFAARRLPRFLVAERDLDPDRTVRVATLDFVATRWRERGQADPPFGEPGALVRDLVIDWIRERGGVE